MDYKVFVENGKGEVRNTIHLCQACFGEMAKGCINLSKREGEFIKSVRYFLMNPESLEDLKMLAKILKVDASFGKDTYQLSKKYPEKGFIDVEADYIEVQVADTRINDAMYKLFILRNFDKYFYGNSHPVSFTLYKEGRIKLIEAVALMNTFKEMRSAAMGSGPEVEGMSALLTYNSVLVDSITTVADFRRFLRNPNDTKPTKVKETFRECGTGYPRAESYICSNFNKNKAPHNTKLIRILWKEVAGVSETDWSVMRNPEVMNTLINTLLQRKVIKKGERFSFGRGNQTPRT